MAGSGRETLPEVWKWSRDPHGGPEVLGDPPGGSEVVYRPSESTGSGRENLREVRKW